MKQLLTLTLLIGLFFDVKGQNISEDIRGTWKIKDDAYKSYTATHFTQLKLDSVTKVIKSSVFGFYTITNGICSETVISASQESSALIGVTNNFKITFKDANQFSLARTGNEIIKETWERVDTSNKKIRLDAAFSVATESRQPPLYVLKDGTKNIKLKDALEKGKSPFDFFPQEYITSVEVLKNEDETALFGAEGKNGVIVFTVVKSETANVIKLLKGIGLVD